MIADPQTVPWPRDAQVDLARFYGEIEVIDGQPSEAWESRYLARFDAPYTLYLVGDPTVRIRRIACHRLVAPHLEAALVEVRELGTEFLMRAGLHEWGGCYCYRRRRGGAPLSVHAWGAAVDLAPTRNPLGRAWSPRAGMMPLEVVEIFARHGAAWGGRWRRPDAMHFQWTR